MGSQQLHTDESALDVSGQVTEGGSATAGFTGSTR